MQIYLNEFLFFSAMRSRLRLIDALIASRPSPYTDGLFPGYDLPQSAGVIASADARASVNAFLASANLPSFKSATPSEFRSHTLFGTYLSPSRAVSAEFL